MQTMIFDNNIDRSGLPQRDQLAWIRLRDRQNLKTILGTLQMTGYMAMAQAAEIYGGAPSNARREIRERLVVPGLVGQEELNGNAYLYMRAPGVRLVTGRQDAEGVPSVPEKTDRTLLTAYARVEWWLRGQLGDWWKFVPGAYEPYRLGQLNGSAANVAAFRDTLNHRNGVYCLGVSPVIGDESRLMVFYVVVDLNRTQAAYRELLKRLQASAEVLYPNTKLWVQVMVESEQRADALSKVLTGLKLKRPIVVNGDPVADEIHVGNYDLQRYTAYAFHRVKPAVLP